MKIREGNAEDLDRIFELWWELIQFHSTFDKTMYKTKSKEECKKAMEEYRKSFVGNTEKFLLVVENEKKIVGYLTAYKKRRRPVYAKGSMGYIDDAYISEDYRNKSLGTQLMTEAIKMMKKRWDVDLFEIHVDCRNPARELWKRLGFFDYQCILYKKA